ncbi:LPXTG cell wall anchor domain-containing protein [Candidatus Woesearchaeota archaeon]|nr:LPXTG cell wall anchor domain-containing protein [Candidatus Woesearchaeota archaeon]
MLLLPTVFAGIQASQVTVTALKYEPAPAEPGSYVDVYVKVQNEGLTTEDFTITTEPEYPFSLATGEEVTKSLGRLPSGEDAVVQFRINVDLAARSETKNLTFYYKYQKQPQWVKFEYPIQVQTQDASLTIEHYRVSPAVVKPGEQAGIIITLKNNGRIGVKNIDVTILPDLDENKFSIVGTGTTKRVPSLEPNRNITVTFDVVADTTAETKVYTIPVNLSFSDVRNREKSVSGTLTLLVGAEPEVRASIDSTTVTKEELIGTVSVKMINSGIVDLKYVNVVLQPSKEYTILSPSTEEYVGNLDSDDFETIDFLIKANSERPLLSLTANFKDPYNKDYAVAYDLPLILRSKQELGQSSNTALIIGAVLVLIILAIIYRFRKKR